MEPTMLQRGSSFPEEQALTLRFAHGHSRVNLLELYLLIAAFDVRPTALVRGLNTFGPTRLVALVDIRYRILDAMP